MPQRRSHTKSRDGCKRCKRRRIKCDESGPPCGTCKARNAECEYANNVFRPSSWTGQYEETVPSSARKPVTPMAETPSQITDAGLVHENLKNHIPSTKRNRELKLMHHWTLKTCHSFSQLLSETFQTYVVQQALQEEFLMDALLALTSLHMATELPVTNEKRAVHLSDALQYQSSAVPAFRAALENISPTNCDTLFACSVIMMACTVVFPSLENNSHSNAGIGKKVPADLTSLFQFVKGIHSVIDQARPSLEEGPFKFVIMPYLGVHQISLSVSEGILPPMLTELCHRTSPTLQGVYGHAVDMLEHCAMAEGMVIPWIVMAGEEFVDQVEKEEPLALLIFICWGALFGRLEEMWWAKVAGEVIVKNLAECITENEESDEVMRWAKAKVEIKAS